MPDDLGSDKDQDQLVAELIELQDHYLTALTPRYREMVTDHKLYLGHREDRRQAHEKWRSNSWMGDPYALTTTETDAWLEIMGSMDPPAQAEGVGAEDEWKARSFERSLDYFLRQNRWTYVQEMTFRNLSIQGWKVLKTGWMERKYAPIQRPGQEQLIEFDRAVNEALKTGQITSPPDPTSKPDEFAGWMESTKTIFPQFPDAPAPAPVETVAYRGPWIFRPSEFDLRFDPFTEDWQEHTVLFQRVVKPHAWVEQQVKDGKFDGEKVKQAGRGGIEDRRLSLWDQELANQIGLSWDGNDPIYKTADELWEVWRPYDKVAPYLVILNRSKIVNVSTAHPFWHRQLPYICVKNVPLERRAFGLGSYAQLRKTFADRLTFRDLLLDGLLLSVMPVFLKSRNLGMAELQRFLTPGAILEVNDPNGLKRGWESMAGFAELMKVGEVLLNDQNTLQGTWENVRGQAATVGRVSATESQGRLTQALVRHKKKAERLEEELSGIIPQLLYNAYQKYDVNDPALAQLQQAIIGEDEQNPAVPPEFTRETFAEALSVNIKFRGATSKLNKELLAAQLKDFLATVTQVQAASGIPTQIMTPVEARNIIRRMFDALGQKGSNEIFTPEGDQAAQALLAAHMTQAQTAPLAAQMQQLQLQMQMQQMMAPPPQVDPNTGQPIQPQPGNGQAPPEQMPQEQPVA